jgi:hypothetical protein
MMRGCTLLAQTDGSGAAQFRRLYVNPTHVIRILGMPEDEGDRLLAELYWYMLQPNAEYRHKWRAGTSSSGTTAAPCRRRLPLR